MKEETKVKIVGVLCILGMVFIAGFMISLLYVFTFKPTANKDAEVNCKALCKGTWKVEFLCIMRPGHPVFWPDKKLPADCQDLGNINKGAENTLCVVQNGKAIRITINDRDAGWICRLQPGDHLTFQKAGKDSCKHPHWRVKPIKILAQK